MTDTLRKDDKKDVFKYKTESLNAILDIYKDSFALEEQRKGTLENKASMVLGFSGIIAGLITSQSATSGSITGNILLFIGLLGSILCFTISGVFALLTVRLKNYMQPSSALTPEQIDKMLLQDEKAIKDELIKNYSDALLNNQTLNNQKASKLNIAFYLATAGIALTLLAVILSFF